MSQDSVLVAGYTGGSIRVDRGQQVRVTDVEGSQVADFFAVNRDQHLEYLSTSITRAVNRNLFPAPGQSFYSSHHRPILTFIEDHSPGIHDMLFAPCDHVLYANRGLLDHPNCRDNYLEASGKAGIDHPVVPDPVNMFQNTPVQADGTLELGLAVSRPGDHVILRAELDLIVIVTACSSERVNGGGSTPIRIEVVA